MIRDIFLLWTVRSFRQGIHFSEGAPRDDSPYGVALIFRLEKSYGFVVQW
jgi:hypothetical protein